MSTDRLSVASWDFHLGGLLPKFVLFCWCHMQMVPSIKIMLKKKEEEGGNSELLVVFEAVGSACGSLALFLCEFQ